MSDAPHDPAQKTIDQTKSQESTYEGQQGYGVEYEGGRFEGSDVQPSGDEGRSGSYETHNTGSYGTNQRGAAGAATRPADPEAQQGQGGQ